MNGEVMDIYAIGARIRMLRPGLSPSELKVVDMLTRPDMAASIKLKDLAEIIGVSEPLVVKTTQKLGFSGYRECRKFLQAYNALPSTALFQEIEPQDSTKEILSKVFNTSIQALQETLAILDVTCFEKVVSALHLARNRDLYGIGGSAQIARDVAHKLLRIGVRASVYDDAHMMLMSSSLLQQGDVAIGFSHSGRTGMVIDALMQARRAGATTIAVTNYEESPLSKAADLVLCSTARGSPLLGENAAARVAQLNIMDAIFAALAQKDFDSAERNLQKTSEAVSEKRRK
ncbi:MurR/RpiR family transcriptional regulator [Asaia prunellae]|uniref:MurR/RpiR family transcriptional regulator n=1 Tax=Asaia prunellae TaxID=610245 RepID=UPI000472C787|nr:MurR/RpiR family transcriptional regulator [Asaia prunellae]